MTGEEKTIKLQMDRLNLVERENVEFKSENLKLKSMLDHALQMVVQVRDQNRQLSAIVAGDPLQVEINQMIADVGGC